ncbi:vesicle transport through interaction with t-SNARE 1 [Strigomonas culicis]|nr:vesicle transport through interaction with t-SNARE 1 [Strigomonas culicis]|eukprot:EPY34381.1 vesicle transport through interaction with t-SNARE 1 [Strigomonas culicis]
MEYECNDVPAASRAVAKERVTRYSAALRKLEEDLAAVKVEASAADREDLIGAAKRAPAGDQAPAAGDLDDEARRHRMQMMDNTEKYKQASGTLNKAERLLNDTETVGGQALTTLRAQTEQLQRINETTIAVDEEVSEARRILQGMQKVMIKHKLILIAIILVLLFLIIVAIYVAVSKSKTNATVAPTQTTVNPITTSSPSNSGSGGLPSE